MRANPTGIASLASLNAVRVASAAPTQLRFATHVPNPVRPSRSHEARPTQSPHGERRACRL
jgi:hypothetical protein